MRFFNRLDVVSLTAAPLRVVPDFLWNLLAPANSMRLSLLKGEHAAWTSASWQEIRVRAPAGMTILLQNWDLLLESSI
jgi:hypothetical protein